ncbi:MAG: hypothetical protein WDZ35_12555 [Crocinitomicaceae bacterium]
MKLVVTFLMLLMLTAAGAQSKKEVKEAHKLFKSEQYAEAIALYEKFITIAPTNKNYAYKYGACLVMLNKNNEKALKYLLELENQGESDKKIAYFIGRAYENDGSFEKALNYYERFKDVADKEQIKKLKIKKRIRACKKALR